MRKLLNGVQVYELDEPVTLTVYTKCPMKYKLVDMETGEEYVGQNPEKNKYSWNKVNRNAAVSQTT
jgi:hypothetical protein